MKIELLYHSPLWVASKAIRKCWSSEDKSDSYYSVTWNDNIPLSECDISTSDKEAIHCGTKDKALIDRVGNQNKHKSTLEHLVYTFDIDGISRACLQEVARHRIASYSVKSTRYTLKELREASLSKEEDYDKFLVKTGFQHIDSINEETLNAVQAELVKNKSNDYAKYTLPEAYKTSLVMTINARSLQNFLELRSSKHALWEIRGLARELYTALPVDHQYLFEYCIKDN